MKITYKEIFSQGITMPKLESSQVKGEEVQYFYDKKKIGEQEFYDRYKKLKAQGYIEAEFKSIIIHNDSGEEIAEVSWFDCQTHSKLEATIQVGNDIFKYKQTKEKIGYLHLANGSYAKSYMSISFGEEKSEYIDKQPRLDDELLYRRDEILQPYLDVMFGNASLSTLDEFGVKPATT